MAPVSKNTGIFLPWEFLIVKKMEFEKTKPTQYTTFKTDIIKVVLVFFDFQPFFYQNFPEKENVFVKKVLSCTKIRLYCWKNAHNILAKIRNFCHCVQCYAIAVHYTKLNCSASHSSLAGTSSLRPSEIFALKSSLI